MSAIAAIASTNQLEDIDKLLDLALQALSHRGPNGVKAAKLNKTTAFGHAKHTLSKDDNASQPIVDDNSKNAIAIDGTILNYKALRKSLEAKGVKLKIQSEAEVALKAYETWGDEAFSQFRGPFAIAIWLHNTQQVVLARDPIGIKQLYIYERNDELRFASETRALINTGIPRTIDLDGLRSCLAFGSVQEPFTLVQNVRSLQPGHVLKWQKGQSSTTRFWKPNLETETNNPNDLLEDAIEEIKAAVKLNLVADVTLGTLLSGGIDSSTIVAIQRQVRPDITPNTFTLAFDACEDERAFAKHVAQIHKTCHKELLLEQKTFRKHIGKALDSYDSPSYDGLNTWYAIKLARETGLRVALTGIGGDELFAGYNQFEIHRKMIRRMAFIKLLPKALGAKLANKATSETKRKAFCAFGYKGNPYFLTRQLWSPLTMQNLLDEQYQDQWMDIAFGDPCLKANDNDLINRISALELTTYMRSTLLKDADQMSAANGIEIRAPLIDHILVEKLLKLPSSLKLSPDIPKPILVNAAKTLPLQECVNRPKRGFTIPMEQFFATSFKIPIKDFLNHKDGSIFNPTELSRIAKLHQAGQLAWPRLWNLFTINTYCNKHNLTR